MATKKKVSKNAGAPGKKNVQTESSDAPTAKELAVTIKRAQEIASGKKNGAIIVLEEFKDKDGDTGIQGMTYWKGMDAKKRVATLLSVSGMPPKVFMLMATLMGGGPIGHEHDKDGNCLD